MDLLMVTRIFAALLLALAAPLRAELERHPTQVGTNIDVGQIVQGVLYDGSQFTTTPAKGNKQVITRTGVYLTESGTYNKRLDVTLTVGGLFWFSLPEDVSFQTRRLQFGPGVGQAQGVYAFGADPANPAAKLQFGLFPHKYSQTVNLGEYLFRSGTYPGTLVTGGWSYLNSAAYLAQGARLSVPTLDGRVTHDLTLYIERDLEPVHDISPGYLLTVRPVDGLEVGGGLVWAHGLSLNSKRLAPKVEENAYSKITNKPIKGAADTLTQNTPLDQRGYYTFKGFKTVGWASYDFGSMLGSEAIAPGSFQAYGEIALLGIENQPYYYEKRSQRMPFTFGMKLPTFGLLDLFAVEMEHHKSSFPETNGSVLQSQLPIPTNFGENPYVYDVTDPRYTDPANPQYHSEPFDSVSLSRVNSLVQDAEWKWTVYGRRKLSQGLSIYAQAASDHLRHFNFTATPAALPATAKPSDWYYVFRLELGI